MMLLREQGGGDEHRHLLSGLHRDERGAHRHLGLAEADVAAYQAVHRRRPAHVGGDLPYRPGLVRCFLERKGRLESTQVLGFDLECNARPACPAGLHFEQLGRHVGDLLRGSPPCPLPLAAAELVQRRDFRIDTGIAGDQMQRAHRDEELVAVRVVDSEELSARAADRQNLEAGIAPDAMHFMHDRRADPELLEVAHDPLGVSSSPATTAPLGGTCAEELRFGNHCHRRGVDARAVLQLGDGHGERGAARDEVAP